MRRAHPIPLYLLLVLGVGSVTFLTNIAHPSRLCWDESFHIPAAYKYRKSIFFMELHPPLGKLLIALGDHWLDLNSELDCSCLGRGVKTIADEIPPGFDFRSARLVPALFAWLGGGVFFLLLCRLLGNPHLALLSSALYLFDNALIVHFRAAMLDGFLYFFSLCALLCFVHVWRTLEEKRGEGQQVHISLWHYALLGLAVGLAAAVKITGLALVLLPACWWLKDRGGEFRLPFHRWGRPVGVGAVSCGVFLLPLIMVFCTSYYVHIARCTRIDPELAAFYLQPPPRYAHNRSWLQPRMDRYRELLEQGRTGELRHFPELLLLHLVHSARHNSLSPRLRSDQPDQQGSHPATWPVGGRPICFRFSRRGDVAAYSFLVPNPAIWLAGLLGIVMALALLGYRVILRRSTDWVDGSLFQLTGVFALLYVAYMVVMMFIGRVMFLYHYFPPLLSSLLLWNIMLAILADKSPRRACQVAGVLCVAAFFCYLIFAPLTYSTMLTTAQFEARTWFEFWQMRPSTP